MFFFYYSFFFFLVGSTWCTAKWSLGQGSQFGHHHHHHHHLMLSAFFFFLVPATFAQTRTYKKKIRVLRFSNLRYVRVQFFWSSARRRIAGLQWTVIMYGNGTRIIFWSPHEHGTVLVASGLSFDMDGGGVVLLFLCLKYLLTILFIFFSLIFFFFQNLMEWMVVREAARYGHETGIAQMRRSESPHPLAVGGCELNSRGAVLDRALHKQGSKEAWRKQEMRDRKEGY
jgi:hypothetical protein